MILKIENGECACFPNGQAKSGPKRLSNWRSVPEPSVEAEKETEVPGVLTNASFTQGYHDIRSQNMPPDDIQF